MPNEDRPIETPVTRALQERGIPFRVFRHAGPLHSLEQAAQERGQRPRQVVRSIVFHLAEGQFVMALTAGPDQLSWPALRKHLGVSRLRMASEEEVFAQTGYLRGAVSPFGLPATARLRILIDARVFEEEEVSLGSGVRNVAVILRSQDLHRALPQAEVGCFVEC